MGRTEAKERIPPPFLLSAEGHETLNLCPYQWVGQHSSCYRYFSTPLTYQEAKQACAGLGGAYLVELLSKPDEVFVSKKLVKNGLYWTGLTDLKNEGQFVWEKRGDLVLTHDYKPLGSYSNFVPDSPDNRGEADCVAVSAEANLASWKDYPCNKRLPYVCENYLHYNTIGKSKLNCPLKKS